MTAYLRWAWFGLGLLVFTGAAEARPNGAGSRVGDWLNARRAVALDWSKKIRHQAAIHPLTASALRIGARLSVATAREKIDGQLSVGSTAGLAVAEFANEGLSGSVRLSSLRALKGLSFVAGAGLVAVGLHDFATARTTTDRFDAWSTTFWGAQGLLSLPSGSLANLAQGFGVAGGLCQAGVGCKYIVDGVRQRDRARLAKGILYTGTGLGWVWWETKGFSPMGLAAYAGVMAAAEIYDNREALMSVAKRAAAKASCTYGKCMVAAGNVARRVEQGASSAFRVLANSLQGSSQSTTTVHVVPR